MNRDLLQEFEEVRKEMEKKGTQLGFQHPVVLELSVKLDRIHNELLKKEREKKTKKNLREKMSYYSVFESKMMYNTLGCMA